MCWMAARAPYQAYTIVGPVSVSATGQCIYFSSSTMVMARPM